MYSIRGTAVSTVRQRERNKGPEMYRECYRYCNTYRETWLAVVIFQITI